MNCHECQELLAARVDGILDDESSTSVTEHLLSCSGCRSDLAALTRLHERLDRFGKARARDRLEDEMMARIAGLQPHQSNRQIMFQGHARFGWGMAAAVLLLVGLTTILWTPSGQAQRGVVLADVVEHMRTSRTVSWKTLMYAEGQLIATAEQMLKGGHLCRTATSDGHIYIQDRAAGRTLALNPEKRTATFLDTMPSHFDFYKFVTEFRDGSETLLGTEQIDGREAIGFAVRLGEENTSIWVDARTQLPVEVRTESIDGCGRTLRAVSTDFVLDSPLDDSLFSLEVPEGYEMGDVESPVIDRARQLALYTRSADAAKRIVKACIRFADEHGGAWPADLDALEDYGIDAQALINPRRPDLAVGWSYRRPPTGRNELADPANTILIHEVLEKWDEGVNVGFADGRVQFIKDPVRLRPFLLE